MNKSQSALLFACWALLSVQTEAVVVDEFAATQPLTDHNIHGNGWAKASHMTIAVDEGDANGDVERDADSGGNEDGGGVPVILSSTYSEERQRSILVGFDSREKEASFVLKKKQQRSGSAVVQYEYNYTKTVRMTVSEEEYQAMLQAQNEDGSGILYIEEEVEVRADLPKPEPSGRQRLLREGHDRAHRKLQGGERVSYGLDMVQGFDYIPPSSDAQQCQIKICIIDSGLHVGHYDIPYNRGSPYVDGEEFGLPGNQYWYNPNSETSHGTAIAGIIAARGGNNAGTLGVVSQGPEASKICLLNARIFADNDYTTTSGYVLQAAEWCSGKGANIINLSLASPAATNTDRQTYRALWNRGILLIAAAGNSGTTEYNYPASLDEVISVGSIGQDRKQSSFSQTNDRVELVAPGQEIYSTSGSDMDFFTGTSFATPYVAGIAAKIWAAHPRCTNVQIREALQKSAQAMGTNPIPTRRFGYGLIRARAANKYIKANMYWPCGDLPVPTQGPTTKQPTRHPTKAPTPYPTFPPQEYPTFPPQEGVVEQPQDEENSNPHCQAAQLTCDGDFTTLGDLSSDDDSTLVSAAGVKKTVGATRLVRICCLGLSCQKDKETKSKICVDVDKLSDISGAASTVESRWSFLVVGSTSIVAMLFGLL